MKFVFVTILGFILQQQATAITLTVQVAPVKTDKGHIVAALYKSADSWLESDQVYKYLKQKAVIKNATFVFEELPPGTYGVSIIHDENDNSKLDMQWLPPSPEEAYGTSNNKSGFGKPDWDDAILNISKNREIEVTLKYPD
tara:strand:- start:124 stop:546 length:423 start_codon:yes stop_codon:yes gene_type:complete